MKGDVEKALEAGMDAYISKPVKMQVLGEMIELEVVVPGVPVVPVVPVVSVPETSAVSGPAGSSGWNPPKL